MGYFDEDYEENYYEPTVADEIFEEYKIKMKDALLESVKTDIDNLKYMNNKLICENQKLRGKESEVRQRERELESKKSTLERDVRNERLSKLMADFQVVMYQADGKDVKQPKCNKCNNDREIEFLSPTGKPAFEKCECDVYKTVYQPQEYICTEFKVDRNDGCMLMWYKENHERDYDYYSYDGSDYLQEVYKEGMEFKDLSGYSIYFKIKEDCQRYCDWLEENGDGEID